jgi:hypothetical protein
MSTGRARDHFSVGISSRDSVKRADYPGCGLLSDAGERYPNKI